MYLGWCKLLDEPLDQFLGKQLELVLLLAFLVVPFVRVVQELPDKIRNGKKVL